MSHREGPGLPAGRDGVLLIRNLQVARRVGFGSRLVSFGRIVRESVDLLVDVGVPSYPQLRVLGKIGQCWPSMTSHRWRYSPGVEPGQEEVPIVLDGLLFRIPGARAHESRG